MAEVTEELQEIRAFAREFAQAELRPHAEAWDRDSAIGDGVLAQLAELGFPGMLAPESAGGMDVPLATWVAVLEALAWGEPSVALALAWHGQVIRLLRAHGTEALRAEWLERLASGSTFGCLALAEEDAGVDLAKSLCRAQADGAAYRLNGSKRWVSNFRPDGVLLVLARAEAGPGLFLVPAAAEGVVAGDRDATMGLRPLQIRTVVLQDVRVSREHILGGEGNALALLAGEAPSEALSVAAIAVGIAEAALEHARGYADVREQFGQKLREFQGLQFKLAAMATRTAAARALLASAAESGNPVQASMAKVFAAESAMLVSTDAVQIFGGYGYMRDYPVEKLMRDAKAMALLGGADELHQGAIAQSLYED